MICEDNILLTNEDFQCIGQVAKHCDNQKLCISIKESRDFDLLNLFCNEFWDLALENYDSIDDLWINVWCGGNYTSLCGKKERHFGLKRIWVYYAYSRYIILNSYNDTATGIKQKTNDFSIPTPLKELQAYENKYRNMGFETFELTKKYLCSVKDSFFIDLCLKCECECGGCGCEKCGKTSKNRGFSSSIITKY